MSYFIFHTIGPTDLLHPTPPSHSKIFAVFPIYFPNGPLYLLESNFLILIYMSSKCELSFTFPEQIFPQLTHVRHISHPQQSPPPSTNNSSLAQYLNLHTLFEASPRRLVNDCCSETSAHSITHPSLNFVFLNVQWGRETKERTAGRAERTSARFISTEARKDDAILERPCRSQLL